MNSVTDFLSTPYHSFFSNLVENPIRRQRGPSTQHSV